MSAKQFIMVLASMLLPLAAAAQNHTAPDPSFTPYNAHVNGKPTNAAGVAEIDMSSDPVELWDTMCHSWSYFSDPTCLVRSLNPADVTITYYGYGTSTMFSSDDANPSGDPDADVAASAVGIGLDAPYRNTYIYHKTFERIDGEQATSASDVTGRCAYGLIPNPFSRRPTYGTGDTRWRGFYMWRLKSFSGGQIYTARTGGTALVPGDMVDAEDSVYFDPAAPKGMTVEWEAIWARAFVFGAIVALDRASAGDYALGHNAYERNFVILKKVRDPEMVDGKYEAIWPELDSIRWQRDYSGWDDKDFTYTAVYPNATNGISNDILDAVPETTNPFCPFGVYDDSGNSGYNVPENRNTIPLFAPYRALKFEYVRISGGRKRFNNRTGTLQSSPQPWTFIDDDMTSGASRFVLRLEYLVWGRMCLEEDDQAGNGFLLNRHGTIYCYSNKMLGGSTGTYRGRIRLESGHWWSNALKVLGVLINNFRGQLSGAFIGGSDYDRYRGDNSKFKFFSNLEGWYRIQFEADNTGHEIIHWVIKSGTIQGELAKPDQYARFYIGSAYPYHTNIGWRVCEVEGGELVDICGGYDGSRRDSLDIIREGRTMARIYMRGGHVKHSVWGAANYLASFGKRRMVFTGGRVDGWVGGGANVIDPKVGSMNGDSYIYFGGHAQLPAPNDVFYWNGQSGTLFGASCGYDFTHTGYVNVCNVVVADHAVVGRDVYGGGYYGFSRQRANVQLLGDCLVKGKVFGGANRSRGNIVDIEMRGGQVIGGIHGGSNFQGTVAGPVNITVTGGTVGQEGCSEEQGNIFGCGYGVGTAVTGDVNIYFGNPDRSLPHVDKPLVYNNIYCGGYMGAYNSTNKIFQVTTYNGRVNGSVFGGGFGNTATITGDTRVSILGKSHIDGNVYGGGNMGKVTGNTKVVIGDDDNTHVINVTANDATMGTAAGGGSYIAFSLITLTATPYDGYRFLRWSDGNTNSTRRVYVDRDAQYVAWFEAIPLYTLTVTANDATMGTVTGGGTYREGTSVTLTATPLDGYRFVRWGDGVTSATRTVTATQNRQYEAQFEAIPLYTLTVTANDATMGTVTGGGTYREGTTVTLTATALDGYRFVQWSDGVTSATRTVTANQNGQYEAQFEAIPTYTITATANDATMGTVTGGGTYREGATVTLTATPTDSTLYKFVQWSDGNTQNPRAITASADASYTAEFGAQ